MTMLNELVPRVVSGRDKRYGCQETAEEYYRGDYSNRHARTTKFVKPPKSAPDEPDVVVKKKSHLLAVRLMDSIQWVPKAGGQSITINRPRLVSVVRQLRYGRSSPNNPLYRVLQEYLQMLMYSEVMQLYIVATGVEPSRKKELGTFMKIRINAKKGIKEFVLPNSFFEDCRSAILKLPR